MNRCLSLAGAFLTVVALSTGASLAETARYTGLCEASAAAMVDENHFAVASDDSEKLRIYRTDLAEPLSFDFEQRGVTDIEGAARIGNTIFWVTSHSLSKTGNDSAKRKVLFATEISRGPSLIAAGDPYTDLRKDIADALGIPEEKIKATLNIEGAASSPAGSLLLALRAPLEGSAPGRAYIIEIDNPFELIGGGSGKRAKVVKVHKLKLFDDGEAKGRGIRSIERAGSRYIIVAGNVEDSAEPVRLYSWDGKSDDGLNPISGGDIGGLVPEALIAWSASDIQILGDNGGVIIDGKECDDEHGQPPGAWFPSDRFPSP